MKRTLSIIMLFLIACSFISMQNVESKGAQPSSEFVIANTEWWERVQPNKPQFIITVFNEGEYGFTIIKVVLSGITVWTGDFYVKPYSMRKLEIANITEVFKLGIPNNLNQVFIKEAVKNPAYYHNIVIINNSTSGYKGGHTIVDSELLLSRKLVISDARKVVYISYAKTLNGQFWEGAGIEALRMFKEEFQNSFIDPLEVLKKTATKLTIGDYSSAELAAKEALASSSSVEALSISFAINWAYSQVYSPYYYGNIDNASKELLNIISLIAKGDYKDARNRIADLINYLSVARAHVDDAPQTLVNVKSYVKDIFTSAINFLHGEYNSLLESETSIALKETSHKLYLHVYDNQGHHVGINHKTNRIEIGIERANYIDMGDAIEITIPSNITEFTYKVDAINATKSIEDYNITIATYKNGAIASIHNIGWKIGKGETASYQVKLSDNRQIQVFTFTTTQAPWYIKQWYWLIIILIAAVIIGIALKRKFL